MFVVDQSESLPWYEFTLPVLRSQYEPSKPTKHMTFMGKTYYYPKANEPDQIVVMKGQYINHGSVCSGYGAKVMYKYYADATLRNGTPQELSSLRGNGLCTPCQENVLKTLGKNGFPNNCGRCNRWCSNRHVPIVHELFIDQHNNSKCGKRGRSICYNHAARVIMASNETTGEISSPMYFIPLENQMKETSEAPSSFVTFRFNNKNVYEQAKKDLEASSEIVFIGNCAVPQKLVWTNFDRCWETLMRGENFDWWQCYIDSLVQPKLVQALPEAPQALCVHLSFDFSVKNHQKLNEIIKLRPHIWLTANKIAIENQEGKRIEVIYGTGPDFPWL